MMEKIELRELHSIEEMLPHLNVMRELYPSLTEKQYLKDLKDMMGNNRYHQIAAYLNGTCVGIAGVWLGTKLWCGKYLEIDNLVVSSKHRSLGIGKKLFEYLHEMAEREGCSMMALDSYTYNFSAHKFFYNEGFGPKGFHFIRILQEDMIR